MSEPIHVRLDREAEQANASGKYRGGFVEGIKHAASIAYRMTLPTTAVTEVPAMDKQVVHIRGRRFSALVNSGVDMREFDRGLAALGIELVVTDTRGLVGQMDEPFGAIADGVKPSTETSK